MNFPQLLASKILLLLSLLSVAACHLYAEQIYKYQDEQGNWHYSQRATNKSGEETLEVHSTNEKQIFKKVWVKEHIGASPHSVLSTNTTALYKPCLASTAKIAVSNISR
jgi:hypothetical protein